jgi:hypothetical protein
VNLSTIGLIISGAGSAITAAGITARRVIASLERRGDRKFALHVFDQTKSTDALDGYIKLCEVQQAKVVLGRKRGQECPVEASAARLPPLQDGDLVAQDQDLGGLPCLLALGQPQPRG